MKYNIGDDGEKETYVYIEPTLEQMYQQTKLSSPSFTTKVTPKFNGFAGKFINMSNRSISLYWYVIIVIRNRRKKKRNGNLIFFEKVI